MFHSESISKRITLATLIVLLLFSLFSLTIGYVVTIHQANTAQQKIEEELTAALVDLLASPIWNLDQKTTRAISETYLKKETISAIKVIGNSIVYFDEADSSYLDDKRFPPVEKHIFKESKEEMHLMGTLTVVFNHRIRIQSQKKIFARVGAAMVGMIILLTTLTGIVFKRILTVPLVNLSERFVSIAYGVSGHSDEIKVFNEFTPLKLTIENMRSMIDSQISDLKEAEKKYRQLLDNLRSCFVYKCDVSGNITYVSASIDSVLGYPPEEIKSRNLIPFLTENSHNDSYLTLYSSESEHMESVSLEIEIFHREGKKCWLEINEIPAWDAAGHCIGIEGIAFDITIRKEAAEQIRRSNKELEQRVHERTVDLEDMNIQLLELKNEAIKANEAKSRFLANMSHELRTPLNAILGFSQLLSKENNYTTEQIEHVEIINRSGNHLLALINDVLEVSKIEAGQILLQEQSFNIRELLHDLDHMFVLKAKEKGITLSVHCAENVPEWLHADQGKVRQILINLIGNAIKFTDSGHIRIKVKSQKVMVNSSHKANILLRIEVEDSGVGISREDQKRIFAPFEQAEAGVNKEGSTGLGLAISREYAKLMHGSLSVRANEFTGSTFSLLLTVKKTDKPGIEQIPQRTVVTGIRSEFKPEILIVDDNDLNIKLLRIVLENVGFSIRAAYNGLQAVESVHQKLPDLIFMDMKMPIMNGYEATSEIKNEHPTLPIIALSASVLDTQVAEMTNSGCDAFVQKPFKEIEIFNAIHTFLPIEYETTDFKSINEAPHVEVDLSTESLSISDELIDEICNAVISGKKELIVDSIQKVEPQNPQLSAHLHKLEQDFNYNEIVHILKG